MVGPREATMAAEEKHTMARVKAGGACTKWCDAAAQPSRISLPAAAQEPLCATTSESKSAEGVSSDDATVCAHCTARGRRYTDRQRRRSSEWSWLVSKRL